MNPIRRFVFDAAGKSVLPDDVTISDNFLVGLPYPGHPDLVIISTKVSVLWPVTTLPLSRSICQVHLDEVHGQDQDREEEDAAEHLHHADRPGVVKSASR
jgi:hypothetical protein